MLWYSKLPCTRDFFVAISDWENTRRVTQLLEIEHNDSLDPAAADELMHDLCTDSAAAASDNDDFRGRNKGGALPVVVGAPGEEAVDAAEDAEGDDVLEAGEKRGVVAGERGEEGLPLRGVLEEKEGGERDGWVENTVFEDVDECVELEEPWVGKLEEWPAAGKTDKPSRATMVGEGMIGRVAC